MAVQDPAKLRNVAVVGHRGCGKTSLVEAMLFGSGAIKRLGSVPDGSTVCDWDEEERRRQMSISASLCNLTWDGVKVNVIDTPGEPSFHADTFSALGAVDGAVMVVNGTAGVEVQTERLWRHLDEAALPRIVVVTMLDRDRSNFAQAMDALRELDPKCVAVQMPMGEEADLAGVVNLVSMTATTYEPGAATGTRGAIPAAFSVAADEARVALVEAVAESDDELIEKYFAGDEITTQELVDGLHRVVRLGKIYPVMCAAPTAGIGADRVVNAVVTLLPSPLEAGVSGAVDEAGERTATALRTEGPAVAHCFKTFADQFSGKINLLRVVSGTLPSDTHVSDSRSEHKERIGQLMQMQGKEHVAVSELGPGDIGAVAKLKDVVTGDILSAGPTDIRVAKVPYPAAIMSFAITPKTKGDEDKVGQSLRRLAEEDPTLDIHRDEETAELILGGVSQLHVETVMERMRRRFGVEAELHPPRVPYRETITADAQAEGKHRKQSGGRGQFGDCWIRIEPLPSGSGIEFVDKVVGGAIPRSFIPAVEKGVIEATRSGVIAGYPVVDLRVTVYDGKHHAVDSSEMAFKIAGSLAMRAALEKARPVLLEPIMMARVTVPEECVGDVMGDLSGRRGRPQGMEAFGHTEVVRAEVPMAEMLAYANDLRAMTGGRGDYTMDFLRYEEVPAHVASKAVEGAGASKERAA